MNGTLIAWLGRQARRGAGLVFGGAALLLAHAGSNVYLTEVPDYAWFDGCFGTATGNLIGYWDRHGFPDFYTGPTGAGLAPLNTSGGNAGIVALWATKAGRDGRPADQPGHEDDYYIHYESVEPDPCVTAGRKEHEPDCIGDFIGLNQNKWKNMNGECDGNIDAYSFVYWETTGARRVNFTPSPAAGLPPVDIQSGLRAWTKYRGYNAEVFTQLTDFNPNVQAGQGFTFEDLKAEIDAGYPVLLFLQNFHTNSREILGLPRVNPVIHGMLAYGYTETDFGEQFVRYRTSWASGDNLFSPWTPEAWILGTLDLPLRGVIGYHPRPQIREVQRGGSLTTVRWVGPGSVRQDLSAGTTTPLHWYVVEKATSLSPGNFAPVGAPTTVRELTIPDNHEGAVFFRVKLVPPTM